MPIGLDRAVWMPAALDVYERYTAMRQLNSGGSGNWAFLRDKWFILFGWSVAVLLLLVLFAIRRMRLERERQEADRRFDTEADRAQLTAEEREIVEAVAVRAKLKRKDTVFTLSQSFDHGLGKLMQEVFAAGQDLVERKKLHDAVLSIKTKLGFAAPGRPESRNPKEQSSRQIPVGTVVQIGPVGSRQSARVQAEVVQNDQYELMLRSEIPLLSKPGDVWMVSFFKDGITWEFESIAMACTADGLTLNHSDRVFFVNRRRLVRIALRRPARLCVFPVFAEKLPHAGVELDFVKAELTEIAGPALRLKTTLHVKLRQRVLVQFEIEKGRVVQDIAQVRDIREIAGGRSIIVELIGADFEAIHELIRLAGQIAPLCPTEPMEPELEEVHG